MMKLFEEFKADRTRVLSEETKCTYDFSKDNQFFLDNLRSYPNDEIIPCLKKIVRIWL